MTALSYSEKVVRFFRSSEETEEIIAGIPYNFILTRFFRTISFGWKQAKVEQNAQAIVKEAGEFYDRLRVYREQANRVSVALNKAVDAQTNRSPGERLSLTFVRNDPFNPSLT